MLCASSATVGQKHTRRNNSFREQDHLCRPHFPSFPPTGTKFGGRMMIRPRGLANLNLNLINNDDNDDGPSYDWTEHTFRQEGVTIGADYLRVEGSTVTRGELAPAALTVQETVGRGAFSTVQKALWKQCSGGENPKTTTSTVAIKEFARIDGSHPQRHMLLQELKTLSKVDSPALLTLHGAFLSADTVTLVLEYMDRGSLSDVLMSRPTIRSSESFWPALSLSILTGLAHLHGLTMLHRDLKPSNVLVHSHNGAVKLCDFGLTTTDDTSLHATVTGTCTYMAPERLWGKPYGKASDVWSAALVLLESWTGQQPWVDASSLVDLVVSVDETHMESLVPVECQDGFKEILKISLQKDPAKRIPASLLLQSPWFAVQRIQNIAAARHAMLYCLKESS